MLKNLWTSATRYRTPLLMLVDFLLFTISYFTSWFMLLRRIAIDQYLETMVLGYVFFIVVFFITFWAFGLYVSLWRYAEAYEFLKFMIATIVAVSVFVLLTAVYFRPPRVDYRLPITVYFISAVMAGGSTLFVRTAYRAYRSNNAVKGSAVKRKKVLVVGTSRTGIAVIQGLGRSPSHRYEVVCAVDDDPSKRGKKIQRVPVSGAVNDIPRLVEKHGIQVILLAVPNASGREKRRISSICAKTTCELKKVPDMFDFDNDDIADDTMALARIEDVSVEDLLGRDVVDIKRFKVKYLAGQTVMVTGAGGTIGGELCRQAAAHGAARIIMIDVVENGLYGVQREISFKFGDKVQLFAEIANIREESRLDWLFATYKPDLVYHAAAHKHVQMMEAAPEEAVKNNIFGTLNAANIACRHGVKRFVLVSTDKAVNPTNVYGATKRVCEMIVQCMNHQSSTEFTIVRFGNVLDSNGSVIPWFKAQIAMGGPVWVTHKDIIRYYMTVSEAVSLVMTAAEMAKGGEIFVLDMGEPVKTLDLAEMLIRLSGYRPHEDIKIEFIGLRPGEKLYEELLMAEEGLKTTSNNKIFVGKAIDIKPEFLFKALDSLKMDAYNNNRKQLMTRLHEIVPSWVEHDKCVK